MRKKLGISRRGKLFLYDFLYVIFQPSICLNTAPSYFFFRSIFTVLGGTNDGYLHQRFIRKYLENGNELIYHLSFVGEDVSALEHDGRHIPHPDGDVSRLRTASYDINGRAASASLIRMKIHLRKMIEAGRCIIFGCLFIPYQRN